MRNRNALITIVVALALSLFILLLAAAPADVNDDPSSRVSGKAGTLALYEWLSRLGFNTHRVSGDFALGGTDVLIVSQPTATYTSADAATVMSMLDRGGDAILAVDSDSVALAQPLLSSLQVSLDIPRAQGTSTPAEPFDAGERVHSVPMQAGLGIDPAPYLTSLLTQGSTITAVAETVAKGRAYVIASPFPLSNDGLRDGDSATLVLSLLERAAGGRIGFDEYHHGEQASAPSGAAAIFVSPLGLALLLTIAAVVLALGIRGRRLGSAIIHEAGAAVPSTTSYIDSMASLFARSDDRGAVATRYADELRARIGADVGVAGSAPDADLVAALAEHRPEMALQVRDVLARARGLARSRPSAAQLLALARDVDAAERSWSEPPVPTPAQ